MLEAWNSLEFGVVFFWYGWKLGSLEVWEFRSLGVWKFGSVEVWRFVCLEGLEGLEFEMFGTLVACLNSDQPKYGAARRLGLYSCVYSLAWCAVTGADSKPTQEYF